MAKRTDERDGFHAWKASMQSELERFRNALPNQLQARLDESLGSLTELERYLLTQYASPSAIRETSETAMLDGASRYVGEVLRKGTASTWEIELDNPRALYFGLPVLKGGRLPPIPACPIAMITTCLDRRTGNFLADVVGGLLLRDPDAERPASPPIH